STPLNRDIPHILFNELGAIKAIKSAFREHKDKFILSVRSISSCWFYKSIAAVPNYGTAECPPALLHCKGYFPRYPNHAFFWNIPATLINRPNFCAKKITR